MKETCIYNSVEAADDNYSLKWSHIQLRLLPATNQNFCSRAGNRRIPFMTGAISVSDANFQAYLISR